MRTKRDAHSESRLLKAVLGVALLVGCDDGTTTSSTSSVSGSTASTGTASTSTSSAGGGTATSGSVGSTTSTAATSTSSTGSGGAGPMDPCAAVMPNCPSNVPASAGLGLKGTDRCAFPIQDDDTWAANDALIDQIAANGTQLKKIADLLLGDLNRTATEITAAQLPGNAQQFQFGFQWESGDENVAYWIPQGITTSGDGTPSGTVAGRKIVLVSWYYDKDQEPGSTFEKGVRLAVVDTTGATIKYRFVLLVEPKAGNPATFEAIKIHAGGLAWFDHWLYVADTTKGFRVFDLDKLLQVDTAKDFIGWDAVDGKYYASNYKYVLPQVDAFTTQSTCTQLFSFAGIDRSTVPPTLMSGEYCAAGGTCDALEGRLFRYKLGADGLLPGGKSWPSDASFMGETQVQGGVSYAKKFFLSSSAPAGGAGALYVMDATGPSTTKGWVDSPEDVSYDPMQARLWSLSEALGARYVFTVDPATF